MAEKPSWFQGVVEGGNNLQSEEPQTEDTNAAADSDKVPEIACHSGDQEHYLLVDAKFAAESLALGDANRIRESSYKVPEIESFILDQLKDYVPEQSKIDLRREGIKHATLEGLCDHLLESSKIQWAAHPSFYAAVILEREARLNTIMAMLPKD